MVLSTHKLHAQGLFSVPDDIAISIAFGFALLAAVYVSASTSGAHLNPAITTGLAVVGEFPWREVPGYVVSPFVGAILAGLADWYLFGLSRVAGRNLPSRLPQIPA